MPPAPSTIATRGGSRCRTSRATCSGSARCCARAGRSTTSRSTCRRATRSATSSRARRTCSSWCASASARRCRPRSSTPATASTWSTMARSPRRHRFRGTSWSSARSASARWCCRRCARCRPRRWRGCARSRRPAAASSRPIACRRRTPGLRGEPLTLDMPLTPTPAASLGDALRRALTPDVRLEPASPDVGQHHRRVGDADVYFLANTANTPRAARLTVRDGRPRRVVGSADRRDAGRGRGRGRSRDDDAAARSRCVWIDGAGRRARAGAPDHDGRPAAPPAARRRGSSCAGRGPSRLPRRRRPAAHARRADVMGRRRRHALLLGRRDLRDDRRDGAAIPRGATRGARLRPGKRAGAGTTRGPGHADLARRADPRRGGRHGQRPARRLGVVPAVPAGRDQPASGRGATRCRSASATRR